MELTRRRAGRYARGRARSRHWEVLRPRLTALCLVGAGWYALITSVHVVWPRLVGDVLLGALLVVPPWLLTLVLVSDPSAAAWSRGADSEEWTSLALRKSLPPTSVVVDDVQLARGNADHVVVGPFGVVVVETKWSSKTWTSAQGYEHIRRMGKQLRNTARSVERLLAEGGVPTRTSMVLVLWGGGVDRWVAGSGVRSIDGTTVVAGPNLAEWAARDRGEAVASSVQITAIEQVLHAR